MKNPSKKAKGEPQQISRDQFENLLKEAFDDSSDDTIDDIVNRVKSRLEGGGQGVPGRGSTQSDEGFLAWLRENPLVTIGLAVILVFFLGVVGLVLFDVIGPDPKETPTATATGDFSNAPVSLRFSQEPPTSASPGSPITFGLMAYTDNGPLSGAKITMNAEPRDAGIIEPPGTDTSGITSFTFTPGNTQQSVTLNFQLEENPNVRLTHTLNITSPQPALSASFKDDPPTSGPIRAGTSFNINFQVDNPSPIPADNIALTVNTLPGLAVENLDVGCDDHGTSVVCNFGTITDNSGSKIITYRALGAGTVSFTPDSYSLTYNGGLTLIPGSEAHDITIEDPRPAAVSITPAFSELAADGTMTTTLTVKVMDQWGEDLIDKPALVEVSLDQAGASSAAGTAAAAVQQPGVECTTLAQITLTPPDETVQNQAPPTLSNAALMQALAYDGVDLRLFVRTMINGSEQTGWVSINGTNGAAQVECMAGYDALPPTPPANGINTPSSIGAITPESRQQVEGGTTTFVYQAGTQAGTVPIVAQLIGDDGNPVGEPYRTEITLREAGKLSETAHLFSGTEDMSANDVSTIILASMPAGTPLELYPPDDATPDARQVALRVWVPAEIVDTDESGQTVLLNSFPLETKAFRSSPPSNEDGLAFSNGAYDQPVQVLGEETGFRLVRLTGWVLTNALGTGG